MRPTTEHQRECRCDDGSIWAILSGENCPVDHGCNRPRLTYVRLVVENLLPVCETANIRCPIALKVIRCEDLKPMMINELCMEVCIWPSIIVVVQ